MNSGIEHVNQSTIKKFELSIDQIDKLRSKFHTKEVYGDTDVNGGWQIPEGEIEREFALDMIIVQLVEVQTQPLGTQVKLPERAIKWLIKEAQEIFKR